MSKLSSDAPLKVMIESLSCFFRSESSWTYKLSEEICLNINNVHVQGKICKTAGFFSEILILNDGTGKAKITIGDQVPGDLSWVKAGIYCSVFGVLLVNRKLPHISAVKIAKISNKILQEMWPLEIMELKHLMSNKILPRLSVD